jgi:hypothetical protein
MNCQFCDHELDERDHGLRGELYGYQGTKYTERCPSCGAGFVWFETDSHQKLSSYWNDPGSYDTRRGDDDGWYAPDPDDPEGVKAGQELWHKLHPEAPAE